MVTVDERGVNVVYHIDDKDDDIKKSFLIMKIAFKWKMHFMAGEDDYGTRYIRVSSATNKEILEKIAHEIKEHLKGE